MLFNIFINDIGEDLTVNNFPFLNGSKISRLPYADNLLLLSTSKTELQHNINKINDFCMKWGLTINVDKSKVVIFYKNGRVSKDRFMFSVGQIHLECVDRYKYLGINVAANGIFLVAEKQAEPYFQ